MWKPNSFRNNRHGQTNQLTEIQNQTDEHDESEPGVKLGDKVDDGDDNVGDRRQYVEDHVREDVVDRRRPAVNRSQHLAGLARDVPSKWERVQVVEQTYLCAGVAVRDKNSMKKM